MFELLRQVFDRLSAIEVHLGLKAGKSVVAPHETQTLGVSIGGAAAGGQPVYDETARYRQDHLPNG